MGLGDIKLLGWLSLIVGQGLLPVILISLICGALVMLPQYLLRLRSPEQAFAFGPFILLGLFAHLLAAQYPGVLSYFEIGGVLWL